MASHRHRPTHPLTACAAALLAGLGLAAPAAEAQEGHQASPATWAGHRLAQLARSTLQPQTGDPRARRDVAATLLAEATQLAPDQAELWRLRIEALRRQAEPDRQALRTILREYLKRSPDDDRAQLRLVSLLVDQAQTVEERLQIYQRLLSGEGERRLGAPLRSRIAMRAAELHNQQGRRQDYGAMLKTALRLDATNPAACRASDRFLQRSGAGRVEQAQALLIRLQAEPTNSRLHARTGRTLLHCGQYSAAAAWLASARSLWPFRGQPNPARMLRFLADRALALWGAGKPQPALRMIDNVDPRNLPDASDGKDDEQRSKSQPERLPVGLQSIRVAILTAENQQQEAAEAFDQLAATLQQRHQNDPDNPARLVDRAWAHLLFARRIERVKPLLDKLADHVAEDETRLVRLRGWLALRNGKPERARQILQPQAEADRLSRYGLALAIAATQSEREENNSGAAGEQNKNTSSPDGPRPTPMRRLNSVYSEAPGTLIGLMAADRLRSRGLKPEPPRECRTVARLAGQVPSALRRVASRPHEFLLVRVEPLGGGRPVQFAEPTALRVTLSNVSPLPLAMGPDGPIPTRLFLNGTLQADDRPIASLPTEVVELDRRLRLAPGGVVTATVHLDPTRIDGLAALLAEHAGQRLRLHFSATLNPQAGGDGGFVPGLLGFRKPAGRIAMTGWPLNEESLNQRISELQSDRPIRSLCAGAWLLHALPTLQQRNQQLASRATEALTAAFDRGEPGRRTWLAGHLPGERAKDGKPAAELAGRALRSEHLPVAAAALVRRADGPDSPAFQPLLERETEPVQAFARRYRQALQPQSGGEPASEATNTAEEAE